MILMPTLRLTKLCIAYLMFQQPARLLDSALLVLHDWSGFILLQENEIDSEREDIREEWRTGNNASRRMWKTSNAKKYPGSQYAKRDVIGDTAIINNFTYKTLRDYYKKMVSSGSAGHCCCRRRGCG